MSGRITEEDLLGLIRKLDIIMESEERQAEEIESATETDGQPNEFIEVTDSAILVQSKSGKRLRLEAADPVQLFVNGKRIEGSAEVAEGDKIEWNVPSTPLFAITVTADRMEAFITVNAKENYGWKLVPKPPSAEAVVEAEPDRAVVLEKLKLSDVMMELQQRNIAKNIKSPVIFNEIQHPSYKPVLIAHGIAPVPSRDATVELFFSEEIESSFVEVAGSIDFRNHLRIPTARIGDVIALKHDPFPGEVGYDVFGNILQPAPPKDLFLFAGDNTEVTDHNTVIAKQNGRPRMTGNGTSRYFDITTAHVVTGDVDMRTGNIVFSGDVIVYGDVTENMIIESLGNVYVTGNVYQATITATGSIHVKGNILSSKLFSGYFGVIFNRLFMSAKRMSELLTGMADACKLLMQVLESRGKSASVPQILMMLLETKFSEIPKVAREALASIENIQSIAFDDMAELKERMRLLLEPFGMRSFQSLRELDVIKHMVQETYQSIERMQEADSVVDIAKCHLTEIKSTGSIFVRGQGALQSQLYAKNDILFLDKDSVFRGGQMESGSIISAYKIGGEHGSDTLVKAGTKVLLRRMSSGKIMVGRQVATIFDPIENVKVTVENNRLVFQPMDVEGD